MRTDVRECESPVPFFSHRDVRIAMLYLINDEGLGIFLRAVVGGRENFDSGVQGPKMVTGGWVGKISRKRCDVNREGAVLTIASSLTRNENPCLSNCLVPWIPPTVLYNAGHFLVNTRHE